MTRDQIKPHVQAALSEVLGEKIEIQNEKQFLISDFQLESIDVVDFIFELEKKSGIEIDLVQLTEFSRKNPGQRFNDLMIQDIIDFAVSVSNR